MGRKCKICGYRFKSKDEAICPECFTARDDDISCERYSASEHSHGKSYSSGLRDTEESFVQKELRAERRNSFARENFGDRANAGLNMTRFDSYDASRFVRNDYNAPQQPYQPTYQPQQQTAYQRFTAQQQRKQGGTASGGFTPAGQIFAQRSMFQENRAIRQPINRPNQKKNSAAAIVFLMFFIIFFIAIAIISSASEYNSNRSNNNNAGVNTYTTTKKTTTASTTAKKAASTTKTTDKTTVSSSSGHFSATLSEVTYEKRNKSEIDKALLQRSSTKTKDSEPWELVTLKVKLSAGSMALADPKNSVIQTVTLQSLENSNAHDTLSYSIESPKAAIDITNEVETTFTLLVHQDAKVIYFNIYLQNSGVTEQCRFNITRD